jgi:hypothetical protein
MTGSAESFSCSDFSYLVSVIAQDFCEDLVGVLPEGGAGPANIPWSTAELETWSLDRQPAQQGMIKLGIVRAIRQLWIGQTFGTVLNLMGRYAQSLHAKLDILAALRAGPLCDKPIEFLAAFEASRRIKISQATQTHVGCQRPPFLVGNNGNSNPPVIARRWIDPMGCHLKIGVASRLELATIDFDIEQSRAQEMQ